MKYLIILVLMTSSMYSLDTLKIEKKLNSYQHYLIEYDMIPEYKSGLLAFMSSLVIPGSGQMYAGDPFGLVFCLGSLGSFGYGLANNDETFIYLAGGTAFLSAIISIFDVEAYNDGIDKRKAELKRYWLSFGITNKSANLGITFRL